MNRTNTRTLRGVRLYARFCFWAGVLVSLAANVLHADPNIISQAVAAWAPLALLLAVELLSHVPMTIRSARSWLRMTATGIVAAIAAWVSYWHMVGVATTYGETGLTPYLLPISVDGLVVVASITLVEVTARIRERETPTTTDTSGITTPAAVATAPTAGATTPSAATSPAAAPALSDAASRLAAQFKPAPKHAVNLNGHAFEQEALL